MNADNLLGIFFSNPEVAHQTLTRKELQSLLLNTGGKIISCGRLRELKSRHLGAGIYEVSVKPPPPKEVKDE